MRIIHFSARYHCDGSQRNFQEISQISEIIITISCNLLINMAITEGSSLIGIADKQIPQTWCLIPTFQGNSIYRFQLAMSVLHTQLPK